MPIILFLICLLLSLFFSSYTQFVKLYRVVCMHVHWYLVNLLSVAYGYACNFFLVQALWLLTYLGTSIQKSFHHAIFLRPSGHSTQLRLYDNTMDYSCFYTGDIKVPVLLNLPHMHMNLEGNDTQYHAMCGLLVSPSCRSINQPQFYGHK